jgi:hypothetical protein
MSATPPVPDAYRVLLPSLAYLRSVRDQTLPARGLALTDALEHFDQAEASDDGHWRDLALLGVIGEGMQILEDLAYLGEAYTGPNRYGLPHYVSATKFFRFAPSNFYQQVRKWPDDRFLQFGGLRFPDGGGAISLHEISGIDFAPEVVAAIRDAEAATIKQMRSHLLALAHTWEVFSKYFHAFKHGDLSLNRDDYFLADDEGHPVDAEPSIMVWHRNKDEGTVHAETHLTPAQIVDEIAFHGHLAHAIVGYIVEARLAAMEMADLDDQGNLISQRKIPIPWRFWLLARDLKPESRAMLQRLGVVFAQD